MLRSALRVAAGLAWSGDPQYRWRLVALLSGSTVLTLSVLLTASTVTLAHRQDAREDARAPRLSQDPAATDVFTRGSSDRWRGRVISTVWIEPASPDANARSGASLAPGMRRLPDPGCAVVSPGLAELIAAEPGLQARYPCRSVLDDAGVRNADELLAYARPRDPRGLGDLGAAIRVEDRRIRGTGPVRRDARIGVWPEPDRVAWWELAIGLTAVVLVPAGVVAAVSVGAASPLRDRRVRLLQALGAPASALRSIAAFEVLLAALPASVVTGATWWAATRLGLGRPVGVLDGDMDLSIPTVVALVALSAAVAGAFALVGRRQRRDGSADTPLSRVDAVPVSRRAVAPMLLAAALFVVGGIMGGPRGATALMLGALVAVAGAPLVIPLTARWLGARFGASRRPLVWLAGRALEWAPRRRVRPFVGLGTLVAILFLGVGYVTAVRHVEGPPAFSSGSISAAAVSWNAQRTISLDALTTDVPGALAVAVDADDDEGVHGSTEDEHPLHLVATCPQLAALGLHLRCDASDPHRLSRSDSLSLGALVSQAVSEAPAPVELTSPGELGELVSRAIVLGAMPSARLDELVRTSAQAALSAPAVSSVENNRPVHTAAVGWIEGAFAAAAVLLSLAVLIAIIDRLLGSRASWQHLLNVGLTRKRLAMLDLQLLGQPWLAATGTGCAVGSVAALAMGDPGDGYPWGGAALVVGAVALLTILAGVAVFGLAVRAVVPERE